MRRLLLASALLLSAPALAAPFVVEPVNITDQKPVFATVESRHIEPARVRTGGTVARVNVQEGDAVSAGQVLAVVGDKKLVLQQGSIEAQIAALTSQRDEAQTDYNRAAILYRSGAVAKVQLEAAQTALSVSANGLKSQSDALAVLHQQLAEGEVLAPAAGRVLKVDLTPGSVVQAGEEMALIAENDMVLRLQLPERYAQFVRLGAPVRLGGADLGGTIAHSGTITLVYPQIQNGEVIADASVPGLSDNFVGERVQAMVGAGERVGFVVPPALISTSFGLDYAHVMQTDGSVIEAPVQRGLLLPQGLEILSGLQAGDRLVSP